MVAPGQDRVADLPVDAQRRIVPAHTSLVAASSSLTKSRRGLVAAVATHGEADLGSGAATK